MPHLVKLNQLIKESVALFSLDGEKAIFVEEVHSKHPLRLPSDTSAMPPLYCTAIGKILLASKAARELEEYFHNTDMRAYTPNTITDPSRLKSHLMTVAKEGVAYDDEELYPGFRSVAVGIRDAEERLVAGIGVQGPSVRLTRAIMKEITPDVKHCAMEISMDLGHRDR
jgi:DNA-binding IclR family transcriptional regulator